MSATGSCGGRIRSPDPLPPLRIILLAAPTLLALTALLQIALSFAGPLAPSKVEN